MNALLLNNLNTIFRATFQTAPHFAVAPTSIVWQNQEQFMGFAYPEYSYIAIQKSSAAYTIVVNFDERTQMTFDTQNCLRQAEAPWATPVIEVVEHLQKKGYKIPNFNLIFTQDNSSLPAYLLKATTLQGLIKILNLEIELVDILDIIASEEDKAKASISWQSEKGKLYFDRPVMPAQQHFPLDTSKYKLWNIKPGQTLDPSPFISSEIDIKEVQKACLSEGIKNIASTWGNASNINTKSPAGKILDDHWANEPRLLAIIPYNNNWLVWIHRAEQKSFIKNLSEDFQQKLGIQLESTELEAVKGIQVY